MRWIPRQIMRGANGCVSDDTKEKLAAQMGLNERVSGIPAGCAGLQLVFTQTNGQIHSVGMTLSAPQGPGLNDECRPEAPANNTTQDDPTICPAHCDSYK